MSLLLVGFLAQTQTPPPTAAAIQEARTLRKIQESLSAALADGKFTEAMLTEHIAATEKSFKSLRESIDKIDEQYDSLNEVHQSAVREAWSIAKLFGVLFDHLKASAAAPASPERLKDLISDATSTTRRAVMLDETLSKLSPTNRSRRPSTD